MSLQDQQTRYWQKAIEAENCAPQKILRTVKSKSELEKVAREGKSLRKCSAELKAMPVTCLQVSSGPAIQRIYCGLRDELQRKRRENY
jgi:hypothetical protein